ncbi:DUF6327 family protein [Winogradskyella thalassocola]|uniref:Uncharacterized protein n=1 Tax=Winogradskyella thalassocola TaxID=262004 RepID=A0A1G8BCF9_9FLAO|nr:hypothetical protein SAMN04489796_102284 [Winogradskyella thalassocola]
MKPNKYNSFEDIDDQLQILSLQKQIYKERIKLNLKNSKASFNANNLKLEFKSILQDQLLTFLTQTVLKKLRLIKETI